MNEYESKMKEGLWIETNSPISLRFKKLFVLKKSLNKRADLWIANCLYTLDEGLKADELAEDM